MVYVLASGVLLSPRLQTLFVAKVTFAGLEIIVILKWQKAKFHHSDTSVPVLEIIPLKLKIYFSSFFLLFK